MAKKKTASRHLLDCRWPIRCQRRRPGQRPIFALASCTRFSPNTERPNSAAARTTSAGCPFDTVSNSTDAASRPDRAHAAEMRCRTWLRLAEMSTASAQAGGFREAAQDVHALDGLTAGSFGDIIERAHHDETLSTRVQTPRDFDDVGTGDILRVGQRGPFQQPD